MSLVLCEGYYKPISCIGVNVFQWKVITLVGCLLVQVCLKAVYLGPFFLLSTLITYHHLFLSPQLYCMPMTPSFLRQCCYLLIAPFFSLTFRHLSDGAPTPVCLLMQARVFSHFCNHSPLASVDYSLNDSVISCVSSCCDLGVIFSSDHSWTEHYKVISKNAYNQLYVIKRSFSAFCPPPIKRLLYISLVHSKLSYYSQVFGDQCSLKTSSLWKGFSIGPPNLLLVLPPSAIENDLFHNICCHLCIFMNTWMSCSVSSAS